MKKIKIIFMLVLLSVFFVWLCFFAKDEKKTQNIENYAPKALVVEDLKKNSELVDEKTTPTFFVAGWLPYWAKDAGAQALQEELKLFSQINFFAYSVSPAGNLLDTAKFGRAPWPALKSTAKKEGVNIVPTILWGDALAMHKIFAEPTLRTQHAENIVTMLVQNDFAGVDLDYEGKDVADRDNFSTFLKILHGKLQAQNKTLNCTVEARTQAEPPTALTGVRAMSFANDFSVLNEFCDSVTIMAYDQIFQIERAKSFEKNDIEPLAPNADQQWVQANIQYALRFIRPEKLILGVATYGWEFLVRKTSVGYAYVKFKSVSYPEALAKAQQFAVKPTRTLGGELTFTYQDIDGQHLVTFEDSKAVEDKINLAKQFKLKGISLFKLDGLMDEKIFEVLKAR